VDYIPRTDSFTFAPGRVSITRSITTLTDGVDEVDETLTLELSNPQNGSLGVSSAEGIILGSDTAPGAGPTISVAGGTTIEGGRIVFEITLSEPSDVPVSFDFETASGTATVNADYTPRSGRPTFQPGNTRLTRTITTLDDSAVEDDEIFTMLLSNPSNASILQSTGVGTIINDD